MKHPEWENGQCASDRFPYLESSTGEAFLLDHEPNYDIWSESYLACFLLRRERPVDGMKAPLPICLDQHRRDDKGPLSPFPAHPVT
jgi:hypothetical protein